MRRYLVVANQTLGGEHLAETIRACLASGPAAFHIVVPATEPRDHAVWTEGEARGLAHRRLEVALTRFRQLGADVDGEVGDQSPLQAIVDAMGGAKFDEIILSTLPPGLSRWLRQDLPHRVERQFDVPVRHVVGDPEPAETRPS
jgi:cell pole-organizing protein PopZ